MQFTNMKHSTLLSRRFVFLHDQICAGPNLVMNVVLVCHCDLH